MVLGVEPRASCMLGKRSLLSHTPVLSDDFLRASGCHVCVHVVEAGPPHLIRLGEDGTGEGLWKMRSTACCW